MNPRANHYPRNDRVPLSWVGGSLAPLQQLNKKKVLTQDNDEGSPQITHHLFSMLR